MKFFADEAGVLGGGAPRSSGSGRLAMEGGARSVAGMTIGQGCSDLWTLGL